MQNNGVIPALKDRVNAVLRRGGKARTRRVGTIVALGFCCLLTGLLLGLPTAIAARGTGRALDMSVLIGALGVALFGIGIGLYLGSSRRSSGYDADVLDIYRDALQVRDEALELRNLLLREQAEMRSLRKEQEALMARVRAIIRTKTDP